MASVGTPAITRATSGSITATWGTGQNRTAGDLLIALVTAGGSTASAAAISTPSGWKQVATIGNTTGSAHAWVAAYTKVAAGSDSAPSFTATLAGTAAMTATLVELDAAAVQAPVDATGTYSSGASAGSLSAMAVTAGTPVSAAGGYAIAVFAQEAAAATNTWNPGGGWSNAANDGSTNTVLHSAVDVQAAPTILTSASETGDWTTHASAFGAAIILVIPAVSGGLEAYVNDGSTTISSGGTGAPAAGTAEFWTAASWSSFPAATSTTAPPVKFHVADPAASSEVIAVLDTATGLVIRGAQGTTPVAHTGGFTVVNVLNASQSGNVAQTYNVRQAGAKGDGTTDDATALQKSLTDCRLAGGGTVTVPAGIYVTSQIPQIGSGTRLKGDGKGVSVIRVITNMAPVQIGSLAGITALQVWGEQPASNIVIEDITFDGNEAGNTSIPGPFSAGFSACIRLDNVDKLTIRNCEFVNSILYNIWLNNCTRFKVEGCTILAGQNTGLGYDNQDGVHVTNSQYGVIEGNIVDTGTSSSTGDDAICLQSLATSANGGSTTGGGGPNPTSDITVTGNVIRSGTRGISLLFGGAPVSNVTIGGNTIWETQSDGIILAQDILGSGVTSNVTITGNTLVNINAGGGGNGVSLMNPGQISGSGAGWQDVAVTGNTFSGYAGNAGTGIYAAGGSGLEISGNILDGWLAETGIQVGDNIAGTSEPVTGFIVSNNTVNMASSSASGANGLVIEDSASGTVTGNTFAGNGGAGSAGVVLAGVSGSNITKGVTVCGNTLPGWATAVLEANAGANPDYNTILDNDCHTSSVAVTAIGLHTLAQHPVPDIGGIADTEQFTCLSGNYTLTSTTAAQQLFNATASGALTVPAGVLFFFEAEFDLSGMSVTPGTFSFGFGGTATFTSLKYYATAEKSAVTGTLAAWQSVIVTTASATALVAASATTTGAARISGMMRINAAGTVIPQVTLSVAAAAVVSVNSWIRLTPVGAGSATSAGNWS